MADQPDPALVALGMAVRARRIDRGFTQERLAEEAGLHPRYVSDIERGRRNVGFLNLVRLSRGLGLDLVALMADTETRLAGRL